MTPEQISPELVERCVALVRKMGGETHVSAHTHGSLVADSYDEAAAIVAELPKPVDPDLVEARELFIEHEGGIDADKDIVSDVRQGAADCSDEIQFFLKGLRRGRELALAARP